MGRRHWLLLPLWVAGCLSPPSWPDAGPIVLPSRGTSAIANSTAPGPVGWPSAGPMQTGPPIPGWPGITPDPPLVIQPAPVPVTPVVPLPPPPPWLPFIRQRHELTETIVFDPLTRAILRPPILNVGRVLPTSPSGMGWRSYPEARGVCN